MTIFVNVPLNNQLDHFEVTTATETTAVRMRSLFEKRWNFWNNIRTVPSILSFVFVVLGCIQKAK
ncbi:MAG: anthrone oxygenase family protein [Fluviicola sp.]